MRYTNTMIYIYALIDPRTNKVRYIGKTNNPRIRYAEHVNDGKVYQDRRAYENGNHTYVPTLKAAWICRLLELGMLPEIKIVEEVTDSETIHKEAYWTDRYGLQPDGQLYNGGRVNTSRGNKVSKGVIRNLVLNCWESL